MTAVLAARDMLLGYGSAVVTNASSTTSVGHAKEPVAMPVRRNRSWTRSRLTAAAPWPTRTT